jgi:hypothetical protein
MLIGSVHLLETLEMLYWLDRVGYAGGSRSTPT